MPERPSAALTAAPAFDVRWLQTTANAQAVRRTRVQARDADAIAEVLGVPARHILAVRAVPTAIGPRPTIAAARHWPGAAPLDLRLFSQELSVLLEAGITLLEAVDTLQQKEASPRAREALLAVMQGLRQGLSPSASLQQAPQAFDALFVAVVAASQLSGQLATTLREHAAFLAWSGALSARLKAMLVYPAMLLLAGLLVVMFLLLHVLPRFAAVFDDLSQPLPAASRALMALGVAAAAQPALAIGLALLPVLAVVMAWHHPPVHRLLLRAAWALPGLGGRLRVVALARLYRVLGLLLGAGVPVASALALSDGLLAGPLAGRARLAQQAVQQGQRLSQALEGAGLATVVAQRMVRVGESSGTLGPMLQRAAGFHDEEIARLADWAGRVVTPVLMLVMGVVIGGIVVLMYLPIFSLMEMVP